MRKRAGRSVAVLLLAATLGTAVASSPAAVAAGGSVAAAQWYAHVLPALAASSVADRLVTAAMLEQPAAAAANASATGQDIAVARRKGLALWERAAKAAPNAPDVAAWAMLACASTDGCDSAAALDRLRALAPADALADLPALQRAVRSRDARRATDALRILAAAHTFNSYWVGITQRVIGVLATLPAFPGSAENASRVGLDVATAIALTTASDGAPAYQSLVAACKPTAPEYAERRADCRRIGSLLENADTLVAVRVGLLLQRDAAHDAAERTAVLAAERRLDWQIDQFLARTGGAVAPAWQGKHSYPSELAGVRARLRQLGVALDPPAVWVDAAHTLR